MYEFTAAEGVRVHPNGVSLVLPQNPTQTGSGTNGPASGNGSGGEASLLQDLSRIPCTASSCMQESVLLVAVNRTHDGKTGSCRERPAK